MTVMRRIALGLVAVLALARARPAPADQHATSNPTVELTGSLTALDGRAATGVMVAAVSLERPVIHGTVTDGAGRFSFSGITPGAYRLEVRHAPFAAVLRSEEHT